MEINKITNQNFQGTFIITPKTQQTRDAIPNLIKKGRQIFYNIQNEGDIVIVTRNNFDRKVRDFIRQENLDYSYYPQISTKSGLDDEEPEKLIQLLRKYRDKVIKGYSSTLTPKIVATTEEQDKYLKEAINTLRLNIENITVKDNNGIFTVYDAIHQRTIKSTAFMDGKAYVAVIPKSLNESTQRFLIGNNGKEIIKKFETPSEMKEFNIEFKRAKETIYEGLK